ncbi:MAG: hypothetical protein NVSMB64_00350 [Candidatus Velthaea sp.]
MIVILVFDGGCGFCRRSLYALKRLDRHDRLELVDGTLREAVVQRFPELAAADLDRAMYAVAGDGVYRGYDAFRRAARALPGLRFISGIAGLGPVAAVGRLVYGTIARNRGRLGCAHDACALTPP